MNIMLDLFVWHQSTCQERVESKKKQNETFLITVGLEPTQVDRILYCKRTFLCYILEYSSIVQIAMRLSSPVFAFNIQTPD